MVSTRTQDGTISTKTYSPLTLDLNALSLQSPLSHLPLSRNTRSHASSSPAKVLKPNIPRKTSRRAPRTPASAKKQKFANMAASEANASMSTAPASPRAPREQATANPSFAASSSSQQYHKSSNEQEVDLLEGSTFFPSVAIGAKETVGLSKIGRADKDVQMWETILEEHKHNMPSLLSVVEERLWQAKHARASLDETAAENVMIGDVNPAESVIKSRLEVLEWALSTSEFEPEAENIKCAIAGYKSGEIGYSDHFTVIYAGHLVDTVPTYGEFVRNRTQMLDRYHEVHGPGWMWYEPPLNVHPETLPTNFPSVALEREDTWTALGGWYVNQGFWKRAGWVSRMAQADWALPGLNLDSSENHATDLDLVNCQEAGPRLSFRSLLDSGATFPSLHREDFHALGIDMEFYAAQSVTAVMTAGGISRNRLFELVVCVLDENGKQLVHPKNPVFPNNHQYLGGLCPVSLCIVPLKWDAHGIPLPSRLSGLLPLVTSYVSSTPTLSTLFLGEDRNSVLGAHRMPGQKRWSVENLGHVGRDRSGGDGNGGDRYGEPKIRFTHRGGLLVDEDDEERDHVSWLAVKGQDGGVRKRVERGLGERAKNREREGEEGEEGARDIEMCSVIE